LILTNIGWAADLTLVESPLRLTCEQLLNSLITKTPVRYDLYLSDESYHDQLGKIAKKFSEKGIAGFYPKNTRDELVQNITRMPVNSLMDLIDRQGLKKVEVGPWMEPICADCYYVEPLMKISAKDLENNSELRTKLIRRGKKPQVIEATYKNPDYWIRENIESRPFEKSSVDLFILKHFPINWGDIGAVLKSLRYQLKDRGEAIFLIEYGSKIPFEDVMPITDGAATFATEIGILTNRRPEDALIVNFSRLYKSALKEKFSVKAVVTDWYQALILTKI